MSIADFLTVLRLILVPFFLVSFIQGHYMQAFVLFAIAGGTDLIDGTIARLLRRQTKVGAFLDPIADKLLMITTVSCLLALKIVPFWFFLLVVGRDLLIWAGLAYFQFKKIEVKMTPILSSKLATLANICTVVFGFLAYLKPGVFFLTFPLHFWFQIFLWVAAILTMMSALQYAWIGTKIVRSQQ